MSQYLSWARVEKNFVGAVQVPSCGAVARCQHHTSHENEKCQIETERELLGAAGAQEGLELEPELGLPSEELGQQDLHRC